MCRLDMLYKVIKEYMGAPSSDYAVCEGMDNPTPRSPETPSTALSPPIRRRYWYPKDFCDGQECLATGADPSHTQRPVWCCPCNPLPPSFALSWPYPTGPGIRAPLRFRNRSSCQLTGLTLKVQKALQSSTGLVPVAGNNFPKV